MKKKRNRYQCDICQKRFGVKRGLATHTAFHKRGIIDDTGKASDEFNQKVRSGKDKRSNKNKPGFLQTVKNIFLGK